MKAREPPDKCMKNDVIRKMKKEIRSIHTWKSLSRFRSPPKKKLILLFFLTSLCVIQQVRHLYPPPAIPFCCTSNATPPLHREPPLLKEWKFFYSPGWSCNALLFQIIKIVIIKIIITTNHYTWFEKRDSTVFHYIVKWKEYIFFKIIFI